MLKITQIIFTCFIKLLKIHFPIGGLVSSVAASISNFVPLCSPEYLAWKQNKKQTKNGPSEIFLSPL